MTAGGHGPDGGRSPEVIRHQGALIAAAATGGSALDASAARHLRRGLLRFPPVVLPVAAHLPVFALAVFGRWAEVPASAALAAIVAAVAGQVAWWRHGDRERSRAEALAVERVGFADEAERRHSASELFVNLARRNQRLVDRQVALLVELEARETDADLLGDLFRLDHLATRIRRNEESLLVLSGDEPPRRWGDPLPLAEVARAAAAEVEEYQRVGVVVESDQLVAGHAVADLAHLLAELIENATSFSPPGQQVEVAARSRGGDHWSLLVEDRGLGMSGSDLAAANEILAEPPEVDLRRSSTLGLHVVARLAQRHGIGVELSETPGGGVTAAVHLPSVVLTRDADQGAHRDPSRRRTAGVHPGLRISPATPAFTERPAPGPARPRPSVPEPAREAAQWVAADLVDEDRSSNVPSTPVTFAELTAPGPRPAPRVPRDHGPEHERGGVPVAPPAPSAGPAAIPGPAAAHPDLTTTTAGGLPRRVPGAHLEAGLGARPEVDLAAPGPATTPGGLPRRVPGTHLAAALGRSGPDHADDGGAPPSGGGAQGPGGDAGPVGSPSRAEQTRAMLAGFHAGQRAAWDQLAADPASAVGVEEPR